ncbi:YdgH/BhsA/McbA-like domain containing protein [Yokenella regensburgei]|uniref:Biofilm stress and motility protein A n=1 Tax=Yokenella regensburgei TaxID=158877 RepID=A0AB38FRG1_9ENTR|nr:YdgH/BhsA/McbA-like domain containing protein [Yokenella regensburgei]KFD19888.1 hypothetical protein GYRE_04231 [Yokenella regensburgei ATCC 49455]QIU88529.1 DUF1471 domain-containing protein [Yokenella regensburgei]SQA60401.1 putative biofilm stress and motility protein A [Yokenella regensburgei]SQA67431.1 putative biofilm stress and motility protein A [Yokenella regensburgei]SUQ05865.1 putative biofilm stress and motility protein A [Yokenella regensburgei]
MKVKNLGAMLLLGMSMSAISATEIHNKSSDLIETGHISVSDASTSGDAMSLLKRKAERAGADYFMVSRLTIPGHGSKWSANAALYKHK